MRFVGLLDCSLVIFHCDAYAWMCACFVVGSELQSLENSVVWLEAITQLGEGEFIYIIWNRIIVFFLLNLL